MMEQRLCDVENRFKNLLKQKGIFEPGVQSARMVLRDRYQELLLLDYEAAIEWSAEGNLWKLVHYRFIEDFRKQLKIEILKLKKGNSKSIEDRKDWKILSSSFRTFLTDATAFYLEFIQKILAVYNIEYVRELVLKPLEFAICNSDQHLPTHSVISPELKSKIIFTIHRTLIYLGDLARYREVHADKV